MAQWKFVEWLLFWLLELRTINFEWDEANSRKIREKHVVEPREVEEVFLSGTALPLGVQVAPVHTEERLGVVGITLRGRVLQVVFTMRRGRIRVISARPASRRERENYEKILCEIVKRV